ncbi:GGDEF domain-containing protein [Roseateles cellulosilyticus]|uniref:diguanylate cyclase n=1 Tax=Pelomonas cellulosilytica TaxID=2906762 RepID=A0ABS8XRD6_9BURK|nr:GGDEF domain-containing protein [Pelomonas sp. P8]MCE4553728.1 GGDEF domain-containing protein [Pelomonas sp. P8]
MKAWLPAGVLIVAGLAPGFAMAAEGEHAEHAELAALVRDAFEDPAAAQAELQRRWPQDATPARLAAWRLVRGRLLLAAGKADAADAVAVELAGQPEGVDRSWLLRALLQEQAGRPAGTLAERAVAGLEARCRAAAVAWPDCDYRAAWEGLRLLQREQAGQGAYVDAEASARRGLAQAQAAGDRHLTALSRVQLALLLQAQDQTDAGRAEIRAALAEAQGDPVAGARVRNFEAAFERRAQNVAGARAALEAGIAQAEQAGAPHLAALLRSNLVDAYMHQGRLAEAQAAGRLALPVLQRFGDRVYERGLHHNLAVAHIKLHQFDAARQELARVADISQDPAELVSRARELRELGDAWADAGQYKEALAAFRDERELTARINERNRASALEELRRKYDTAARQRDLDLLARDGQIKDRQLENRRLAQRVGLAVGALLLLSLALIGVVLLRMRRAQALLSANQRLLRAQSERDPLTDLSNRRHFLAVMDQRARTVGADGFRGALLMIDIDQFKTVNDRYGHAAGDAVIVEVGRRIRAAVRASDLVVRWGGEEFLVYAPELPGDDLAQMAVRVLGGIAGSLITTDAGTLRVTASIGFASFPLGDSASPGGAALRLHWEQAVNWADMALYKAKAEGRNRAIGIAAVQAPDADALTAMLQDLDAACLNGQVKLNVLQGPAA